MEDTRSKLYLSIAYRLIALATVDYYYFCTVQFCYGQTDGQTDAVLVAIGETPTKCDIRRLRGSSCGRSPANRMYFEIWCANGKSVHEFTVPLNTNLCSICHSVPVIPMASLGRLNWAPHFGDLGY